MDKTLSDAARAVFREYGRKGGIKGGATNKKKGSEYFKELQKRSVEARKRNKDLSTDELA